MKFQSRFSQSLRLFERPSASYESRCARYGHGKTGIWRIRFENTKECSEFRIDSDLFSRDSLHSAFIITAEFLLVYVWRDAVGDLKTERGSVNNPPAKRLLVLIKHD